jgi:hypothetical protein
MDTIPPTPHEVATARSTPDFDWRNYVVRRIKTFKDRRVGSLSHGELEAVTPWMGKVKGCWATVDREIKYHYIALKFARQAAGIQGVALPVTETPHPTHPPEPSAAPQQSFKVPPARLSSSRDTSQVREIGMMSAPAPISSRPAQQQSEFVSDDAGAAEQSPVEHDRAAGSPVGVSSLALAGSEPDRRLAVFQHICEEIRRATTLPEALSIKAQAENMKLQSLLDQDKEAQRRYAAVRLAAMQKIGELIGDLEKQPLVHDRAGKFTATAVVDESEEYRSVIGGQSGHNRMVAGGNSAEAKKTKTAILKENRISSRTALRYQTLAGSPAPEIRQAVKKASAAYFTERLQNSKTPKAVELLEVVTAASGLPPKPGLTPAQQRAYVFLRWLRRIGKEPDQYSGTQIADYAKQTDEQSIAALRKILVEFDTRFKLRFPQPQPEIAS